jgi:alanine dehydrogenase
VEPLRLGVLAHSAKENERRLAIHPRHLERIDGELLARISLEEGYGERFGVSDERLSGFGAGVLPRTELIAASDVVLMPKPLAHELAEFHEGQVLWGWPHVVQDEAMTQAAIDRRLTLIAFEAMNHWDPYGAFSLHVFHKNNEIAGYSSVLHALQLIGSTGHYGRSRRAVVIGFGATARGAVTALNALGIHDVDVLTVREVSAVAAPIPSVRMVRLDHHPTDPAHHPTDPAHHPTDEPTGSEAVVEGRPVPLVAFLAEHDLVVNCVLQDTSAPWMFVRERELGAFAPGSLIVDVSCDEGMGFDWARPTSFEEPMFDVGDNIHYYAVDHSPSLLWDAATWEVSEALLPYLPTVLDGPGAWDADETIRRAIEIRDGVIQNPEILAFQQRATVYPHARREAR